MNVIVVVLQTRDATRSCKAHVFRRSRGQDASNMRLITSIREIQAEMGYLVNKGSPTPTRHTLLRLEGAREA